MIIFSLLLCMEKIIIEYLTQYYFIQKSAVGNYGIYKYEDNKEFRTPTDADKLIGEIKMVFSMNTDNTFLIIHNWTLEQMPDVDLSFYWKTNSELGGMSYEEFQNEYNGVVLKPGKFPKTLHMRYLNLTSKKA